MATYTAYSDHAFIYRVSIDPNPVSGQTTKVSCSSQFVYKYGYQDYGCSATLAYSVDSGSWVSVGSGGSVNIPAGAKSFQLRLSYSGNITDTYTEEWETQVMHFDYINWTHNAAGETVGKLEGLTYRTEIKSETYETTAYSKSGTWYSEVFSLNNSPLISGADTDLGEKSTAFNIEFSVNDTDTTDTITVYCYYDDALTTTFENVVRNEKYRFMISNEMLAPSPINSTHTIKIEASDGKGSSIRTYTFLKNRNPEPYMDYIIKPVQTNDMATVIVVGQAAAPSQNFQVKVYVCNNAFDEQPMWEDMSDQYYQGLSYSFLNTSKTADKWGISVRFVNSKYNENDQIDITGCGFWCNKMIVGS